MSTEKPHNEDTKPKPEPKKRQPVKKRDPQAERIAATLVIIGCAGAVATGVLAYYHSDTPLVWTTFLSIAAFLAALYFHWRNPSVQVLCTSLGVILFIGCLIWQHRLLPESKPLLKPQSLTASPSPNATPFHEERVLLDVKPEYLLDFFKKYNNAQAQKLVETYIGKWVKLSGIVANVYSGTSSSHGAFVVVFLESNASPPPVRTVTFGAGFDEQRWVNRALVLKPGETVTVFGRITSIEDRAFMLDNCEVIE